MSTPFPRSVIKEDSFSDLRLGTYNFEIESAAFDYTRDMVKQIVVQNRVMEGTAAEGLVHFERYTIGTQADKEADDPNTLVAEDNFGAKFFNNLLTALEFPAGQDVDLDEVLPALTGLRYTGKIKKREGKDRNTGELTGKTYTNIGRYYKLNAVPQYIEGEDAKPGVPRNAAPAPKPVLRPTNGQAGAARVAAPARPAPKPANKPAPSLPAGFSVED